jgi:hypothetical protein
VLGRAAAAGDLGSKAAAELGWPKRPAARPLVDAFRSTPTPAAHALVSMRVPEAEAAIGILARSASPCLQRLAEV